ncbi:MAG: glycosyltransferase family 9 protein [Chthoniobacterales bacterium]
MSIPTNRIKRILVMRGGAIGDFVLTLPALKALREAFPSAQLDILGYKHIAAVAERRFYADAVRSIEYGPLAGFFARSGDLDEELRNYFASFDLVISYLYDPDGILRQNLERSGVRHIVFGPATIRSGSHATHQLGRPVEQIGVSVTDYVPRLFPAAEDVAFAREFVPGDSQIIAIHIGSGSPKKNWAVQHWLELGDSLLATDGWSTLRRSLIVVSGEADETELAAVKAHWADNDVKFATNLPLPKLAAVLGQCVFIGHDSGISHVAAAAGAKSVVLFGPTDPGIWAPRGSDVRIIEAPNCDLSALPVAAVIEALGGWDSWTCHRNR